MENNLQGRKDQGSSVRIKLCGLRREEDIRFVNEARPDFAGFILAEGRKRTVTPERMRELSSALDPGIRKVAVFLDQDPDWVASVANEPFVDLIQLHGSESDEMIEDLQKRCQKPVIKAFRIDTASDAERAQRSRADYVLLDHGAGGTGEAFDWSLITAVKRPFFLAGGLDSENVREAIRLTAPWAVDVSSGVETDGVKDPEKIRRFTEAARNN